MRSHDEVLAACRICLEDLRRHSRTRVNNIPSIIRIKFIQMDKCSVLVTVAVSMRCGSIVRIIVDIVVIVVIVVMFDLSN